MLHRPADMTQHGQIVSKTLRSLICKGLADYAGVSVYYPEEIDTMLDDDIYQAVQLPINLFDLKMIRTGKIQELARRDITVFARSIFLQGLFFLDPDKITDPDLMVYAKPYLSKLRSFAKRSDMTLPQFAVSFIRDIPGISSLVLGAERPLQVTDDIALLDAPKLSENTRKEAENTFRDVDFEAIMKVLRRPKK
jgi:aryl-alcohol dehydrogenase-like predicted oxidoreductase